MTIIKTVIKIVMATTLGALLLGSASLHAVVWNRLVSKEDVLEKARPMSNVVNIIQLKTKDRHRFRESNGSGVLIGPQHVLTVAHVASELDVENSIVCLEDAAGNLETRRVIGVKIYQMPEGCIPEGSVLEEVERFLASDTPAIVVLDASVDVNRFPPAELYRGSAEALCGEKLYGSGYGKQRSTDSQKTVRYPIEIIDHDLNTPYDSRRPIVLRLPKRAYYEIMCTSSGLDYCVSDYDDGLGVDRFSHLYFWEKWADNAIKVLVDAVTRVFKAELSPHFLEIVPLTFTTRHLNGLENDVGFEGYPDEGDSGSPLFNDQNEIVALAMASGKTVEIPYISIGIDLEIVMYTPVAPYSDWIQSVLDSSSR